MFSILGIAGASATVSPFLSEQSEQREQSEQYEQREQSEQYEQSEQSEQSEQFFSDVSALRAASSLPHRSMEQRFPLSS
jgi:hypothetical protein